jgi:hypothetical protein
MPNITRPTLEALEKQRRDADFQSDWKRLLNIDNTIFKLYGIRYTAWGVRRN